MAEKSSRRRFIRGVAAASATVGTAGGISTLSAQQTGRVRGFDHVALPLANTDAMLAFYRALGCDVIESVNACSVYFGDNMINFHRNPKRTGLIEARWPNPQLQGRPGLFELLQSAHDYDTLG
jgi:hypothetical protein